MATQSMLVNRLRLELGDPALPFQAQVETDGETDRFNLPVELIDPASVVVILEGTFLQDADDEFEMDYRAGVITLPTVPVPGQTLVVEGYYYETFLTEDLDTFVSGAFLRHTAGRENEIGLPMTMSDLPPVEEYLVVLLAEIDAIWSMITDAAQDIDIRSPDGITIPVGQRYQQLLGLLQLKKRQYEEMAQALNVGLHRIEMLTLRRTSRTTNRLVPIYKAMEYDQIAKGFTPDYGPPGTIVSIRGDRFTGATGVSFGGVAATEFEVRGDGHIVATVPAGAQSGQIVITTPGGVATTHYQFHVGHGIPRVEIGSAAMRVRPAIDDGLV